MKKFRNTNYYVTSAGEIYSKNKRPRKLKTHFNPRSGFNQIKLYFEGKYHCFLIHRIVAECYLEDFSADKIITHKDQNKTNNDISNLEFSSYKEVVCRTQKTISYKLLVTNERKGISAIVNTQEQANQIVGYKHRAGINAMIRTGAKNRKGFIIEKVYDQ